MGSVRRAAAAIALGALGALGGSSALAAAGCAGTTEADATTEPLAEQHEDVSLAACGAVVSYRAASPDSEGTLALDRRTWSVVPGAKVDGADLLVPGAEVCVRADLDAERRIVACAVSAAPDEDPWAEAGLR
jgi:hypothetical protein